MLMNCLTFKTQKEYFDSLTKMSNEELHAEYEKNIYLCNRYELAYNILRSHIYLSFIEPLTKFVEKKEEINPQKLEEIIIDTVKWCVLYLEICAIIETTEKQASADCSKERLFKNVKESCLKAYRCHNSLIELCVLSKNCALYLSKKMLNKTNYNFDQVISYEGEESFEKEEDVKRFEHDNTIADKTESKDIINEVLETIILDIPELDWDFTTDATLKYQEWNKEELEKK